MATGSPDFVRAVLADYKIETRIDWPAMFPSLVLGPHRDPVDAARKICADVDKLRSCSEAARRAIKEERCARAGLSVDGVPTFYINRTRNA